MFNVYKSRRSDVLTTLPERVVHGLCEDSAAGAVSGVVNIAGPAVGFCGVCGDCCDGGIGDGLTLGKTIQPPPYLEGTNKGTLQ